MKNNLLTLGIAAAVGSLGLASSALAQEQATSLKISPTGKGHMLIVPYYTVQSGNATLLNIVNSDKVNGKAVKLRFRGATNADSVFDFTLLLGPGDVWAAQISQNPGTGFAHLATPDNSCTLPPQVNADFLGRRVNPAVSAPNETREGYVEIITMADVPPSSTVFNDIQHTNGIPPVPCSGDVGVPAALYPLQLEEGIAAAGLGNPTTGLYANWSIFNLADATSWAGEAIAIVAVHDDGQPGFGRKVMFPQTIGTPMVMYSGTPVTDLTADPLLTSGAVAIQRYDLPDLSTPYTSIPTPAEQASLLSSILAKSSLSNEYSTDDVLRSQTDWVFTMPTLRYYMAINYATGRAVYSVPNVPYFNYLNTAVAGLDRRVVGCAAASFQFRSRSQQIDPATTAAPLFSLCGALTVLSINAGDVSARSALAASVTRQNVELSYFDGWGEVFTLGNYRTPGFPIFGRYGLPVTGLAFYKATIPNIAAGVSGNFGLVWAHRFNEPVPYVPPRL